LTPESSLHALRAARQELAGKSPRLSPPRSLRPPEGADVLGGWWLYSKVVIDERVDDETGKMV
jgi:hypothetical protein